MQNYDILKTPTVLNHTINYGYQGESYIFINKTYFCCSILTDSNYCE